jgi:riboflavin synthase
MFTGIVTAVGQIERADRLGNEGAHGKRLVIRAPDGFLDDVVIGDSVALNGACMTATIVDATGGRFGVDVSAESLARTAGLAEPGSVNLEKALRLGDRLGGHMVSGHVDGVGTVTHFAPVGESWELRVAAPPAVGRLLAYKGSVAVNGVSLTVNRVTDGSHGTEFSVNLIPHTVRETTLQTLASGDRVNLEVDLVARYVARMLSSGLSDSGEPGPLIV